MHCLIVDDDRILADRTSAALETRGHSVIRAASLAGGFDAARRESPDVIVLDRMLPDGDSADTIPAWRGAGLRMPILLLTVRSALHERIEGLDAGADDFIAKPFDVAELEARLRALVRMSDRSSVRDRERITAGSIELDYRRREVRRHGKLVPLQPREFKLLEQLMLNAGETVTRSQLLSQVWNLRFDPRTKLIETHVSRLRDKINAGGLEDPVVTVRGLGYRLRVDG